VFSDQDPGLQPNNCTFCPWFWVKSKDLYLASTAFIILLDSAFFRSCFYKLRVLCLHSIFHDVKWFFASPKQADTCIWVDVKPSLAPFSISGKDWNNIDMPYFIWRGLVFR